MGLKKELNYKNIKLYNIKHNLINVKDKMKNE